jgi:hypothetical protein
MKRYAMASSERMLGYIGLFAIGALAVAVDRIERDATSGRSTIAGRAAHAGIAAIGFVGSIVDRVFRSPDCHSGLVAHRESGVK